MTTTGPSRQNRRRLINRLFCPLEIKSNPDSILAEEYGSVVSEFEYASIPSTYVVDYIDDILAAIEKERLPQEGNRGLAHF